MATGMSSNGDDLHVLSGVPPSFWHSWLSWTYAGVDPDIPGNGGPECIAFIPTSQKIIETFVFLSLGVAEICWAWPRITTVTPKNVVSTGSSATMASAESLGRRIILMVMSLTFGAEIGFKLASRQLIWILNPCHLVTMMQIYLLVAAPSKIVTAIFRIQMHCLNGATIAMIFPILNTRTLPFETHIYYIQHALMLIVPIYLLRLRGVYTPEPLSDYSWVSLTLGVLLFYHFIPLQCLALLSVVNLNNMMCPAVSDPFYSRWYRLAATTHQSALILFHGKLYVFLAEHLLRALDSFLGTAPKSLGDRVAAENRCNERENRCNEGENRCVQRSMECSQLVHDNSNGFMKLQ